MELTVLETGASGLRASYRCPCGCSPSVEYSRGAEQVEQGCCCGNHFAVGPRAGASLSPTPDFRAEVQVFDAHWGEGLEAAWLVGPSVHGPAAEPDHLNDHDHDHDAHGAAPDRRSIDPVCGMTVAPDAARTKDLHSTYRGTDYYFCGKGCKLEFDEDPERYLDPGYVPSM